MTAYVKLTAILSLLLIGALGPAGHAQTTSPLAVGTAIVTTAPVDVVVCQQIGNANGVIVGGPQALEPGTTWWQINYATGCTGWTKQASLAAALPPATLTVAVPAAGATVTGTTTVSGVAGSTWKNVAVFDSAWNKIGTDTAPSQNAFSIPVDTTKLTPGAQTWNVVAWSVAAGQPGGTSATQSVSLMVQAPAPPPPSVPSFLPPGFGLVWDQEFKTLPDIGTWSNTTASQTHTWFAHTPWNGDYGDSTFDDPGSTYDPFSIIAGGGLRIRSQKDPSGNWHSGNISSGDPNKNGFSCQYCYFEARMKLPNSPGTWPAFWLGAAQVVDNHSAELDVIEQYGQAPTIAHTTMHNWGVNGAATNDYGDNWITVPDVSADYHDYGILIDPVNITVYYDGKQVYQQATYPAATAPLYPLVTLAMGGCGGSCPITAQTLNPSDLLVQYVRVYSK